MLKLIDLTVHYLNDDTQIVVQHYLTNEYYFEGTASELFDIGDNNLLDRRVMEIAADLNYVGILNILIK